MSCIYWVAVEEIPTNREDLPKLVLAPEAIVARDEKDAALRIALSKEELKKHDPSRLNVIVRPF